jgi:hypothetical protein
MIDLTFVVEMVDFFGCGSHRVNPFLLRIAMNEDRPEWLRGCPKLHLLPRWEPNAENLIKISKRISVGAVCERLIWVVEELQNGWCLTEDGFLFEDQKEAIHFKLMWS